MQTKEAEKERKRNLDWCLCGKCKVMSTNPESLCCRERNELSDKILNGNILHFCLYNMNFMHTEAGVRFWNNRSFLEIKIQSSSKIEPVDGWLGSGKMLLKLVKLQIG